MNQMNQYESSKLDSWEPISWPNWAKINHYIERLETNLSTKPKAPNWTIRNQFHYQIKPNWVKIEPQNTTNFRVKLDQIEPKLTTKLED